ncbi:hypothetical protein CCS01_14050 [Rhodopila globiformis]|uniref:Uncharacterized protein n=1 Tax=Rhodopila globiformis TaxID=1071 RepID=A0A2S6NG69_RHOGL|nr:hypothetical protein CCS01_14050 [Rhodopila globiformis]
MEILRLRYAETLRQWCERSVRNRTPIRKVYDDCFCRIWDSYLAPCETASQRTACSCSIVGDDVLFGDPTGLHGKKKELIIASRWHLLVHSLARRIRGTTLFTTAGIAGSM